MSNQYHANMTMPTQAIDMSQTIGSDHGLVATAQPPLFMFIRIGPADIAGRALALARREAIAVPVGAEIELRLATVAAADRVEIPTATPTGRAVGGWAVVESAEAHRITPCGGKVLAPCDHLGLKRTTVTGPAIL
jgi:hypothetical protein